MPSDEHIIVLSHQHHHLYESFHIVNHSREVCIFIIQWLIVTDLSDFVWLSSRSFAIAEIIWGGTKFTSLY